MGVTGLNTGGGLAVTEARRQHGDGTAAVASLRVTQTLEKRETPVCRG